MRSTICLLVVVLCLASGAFASREYLMKAMNMREPEKQLRSTMATCRIGQCATTGRNCLDTSSITYFCTDSDTYCNTSSNVCTAYGGLGAYCDSDSAYCKDAYVCVNNVCSNPTPVVPRLANGAACTANRRCLSGICDNSTGVGICVGRSVGQNCSSTTNCNIGDFTVCDPVSRRCVTQYGVGAACNPANDLCTDFLICSSTTSATTGVCSAGFQKPAGSSCYFSVECADLMSCVGRSSGVLGTCQAPAASSYSACSDTNPCSNSLEDCECNYNTGSSWCVNDRSVNPSGVKAFGNDAVNCVAKKCSGSKYTEECVDTQCANEVCKSFNALSISAYPASDRNYPTCLLNSLATITSVCASTVDANTNTSAASLSALLHTAALLASLAVLFF